jgi:hypothetical protein
MIRFPFVESGLFGLRFAVRGPQDYPFKEVWKQVLDEVAAGMRIKIRALAVSDVLDALGSTHRSGYLTVVVVYSAHHFLHGWFLSGALFTCPTAS